MRDNIHLFHHNVKREYGNLSGMKLAHFRTNTILSGWSNLAIAQTLRDIGHRCLLGAIPVDWSGAVRYKLALAEYERIITEMPTIGQLAECDAVLVSGPEYIFKWLEQLYGSAWKSRVMSGRPVIAFHMESSVRKDRSFNFEAAKQWANVHYYPDPRDAERFKGLWQRPAVDLFWFMPLTNQEKRLDVGFAGSLYSSRSKYLEALMPHMQGIEFRTGFPMAADIFGEIHTSWVKNYLYSIASMKIHLCLPSNNSSFDVGRVYETLAVGTFCLAPFPDNPSDLKDKQHLCRYVSPEDVAKQIRHYLAEPTERQLIASIGHEWVKKNCDLRLVLERVLEESVPGYSSPELISKENA
jgi:hypothetical protein